MHLLALAVAHLVTVAGVAGLGVPMGIPPGPEDPALTQIVPERCLFYYNWCVHRLAESA